MTRQDPNPTRFDATGPRTPGRDVPKQITVNNTRPEPRMCARVFPSAGQTVTTGTNFDISWNSESFDPQGLHDPADNTKLTLPSTGKVSGVWLLIGTVNWSAGANPGLLTMTLRKNNSTIIAGAQHSFTASQFITVVITDLILDPALGDFYQLRVTHDSGVNCSVSGGSENSYFELIHLW